MSSIKENISEIREKIVSACALSNGNTDVMLLAVTKTRTATEINEAIENGITNIGENRVQEILDKYDQIKKVNWHMIGHLQTNKVKYIIDKVDLIHSVDSYRLAEEINRRAFAIDKVMDILIQVNVSMEESKFGIFTDELSKLVDSVAKDFKNVRIVGLMTIAPFDDPENVRTFFKDIKIIYEKYAKMDIPNTDFKYLSMGMSNDYEVAVAEGATIVRVGSAIFGGRIYV